MTDNSVMNSKQVQLDVLDSIELGIVVLDRDFNTLVWNQFMENHSGIVPKTIRQKCIFDFFPEIDRHWFEAKTRPIFNLNSPAFIIWEQRPFLFKFDANRPITCVSEFMYQNVHMFPLKGDSGDVEQICIVVYDVTDEALNKKGNLSLNQELQEISRIDGLSGLFNRRYWDELFQLEYKRIVRSSAASTVIMLDIDHFKAVNDTHGHPAGDFIIKTLAKVVQYSIRETDICGRYGGEEFVVILPETTGENSVTVAQRIRKACEKLVPVYEEAEIRFTVSVGIAQFDKSYGDPIEWLEKADKALYKAKNGGRNQVCMF